MGFYWQNFSRWLGDVLESQGVLQILGFCKAYSEITHCMLLFLVTGFASTGDLKNVFDVLADFFILLRNAPN